MNEEELVSYVVRYCKHELSEEEYRFYNGGWRKNRKIGKLSGNG